MYAIRSYYGTIGDVLAELDERAEAMGAIIVEVDLNGRSLSPEELAEACAGSADGPGTVSLIAESAAGLKARGLESLVITSYSIHYTKLYDKPRPKALEDSFTRLLVGISSIWSPEHDDKLTLWTDEHRAYPRAIARVPELREAARVGRFRNNFV